MKADRSANIILLAALTLCLVQPQQSSARGGFGGGFRGSSFGGGFRGEEGGFRNYAGRGFDEDRGLRSDAFGAFDRGFDHPFDGGNGIGREDRPDAFNSEPRPSDPRDNGIRNYGSLNSAGQARLASDNFGSYTRNASATNFRPNSGATRMLAPASLNNTGRLVRSRFNNYGYFGRSWWAAHPGAWWRHNWDDYWPWRWGSWAEFAPWWGVPLATYPAYYDFGDNICYDDGGYVQYGNEPVCTQEDYYQQASQIAAAGGSDSDDSSVDPAENSGNSGSIQSAASAGQQAQSSSSTDSKNQIPAKLQAADQKIPSDYKPFGVYSLVQQGQSDSALLFQICSNKKGQIRGNYYNCLTNEVQAISGSVDRRTMRAAWTVGKEQKVVYDTGVANLLKEQSPILIHFDKDKTQQWTLVRLKNPHSASKS